VMAPEATTLGFHPLSASAATISLSSFGAFGPFSFDGLMAMRRNNNNNAGKSNKRDSKKKEAEIEKDTQSEINPNASAHEAMGSDWLATGNCPIAKSFRAVSGVLPLVSKMMKLPAGVKYRCPPAIVAARAALARTSAVKALRPQALPTKVLAIGVLGMALNVPLGVWRQHTKKFSPQWFLAVHATIPFIAMLRKAVVMPKYAVAFTIGSAVLGQAIGARAEKIRLAEAAAKLSMNTEHLNTKPHQVLVEALPCEPSSKVTFDKHKLTLDVSKREDEKQQQQGHVMVPKGLPCGSDTFLDGSLSIVSSSPRPISAY